MSTKRRLLFIQGGGKGTHDEWDHELVASLRRELGDGFAIAYPRMPDEDEPHFAAWKPVLVRELARLRPGDVAVGHSIGGTMLLATLAERSPPDALRAIVLLSAPFVGKGGWPSDELSLPVDAGTRLSPDTAIHLFHGLDDDTVPPSHLDLYAGALPRAELHRLPGRNHQLNDDLKEVAKTISSL